jgi:DNA-3-methyladenine glycosylase II
VQLIIIQAMPKPHRIASAKQLDDAVAALIAADARLHPVLKRAGKPQFVPRRKHGFEALMSIITSQQLSVAAGDTIFSRVKAKVAPFDPPTLLAMPAEDLRACGLSAPKQKHMKTIAAAILDGSLDLKRVRVLHDDDARAHLTAIKGIGPWTADIYLMSSLGRADVWPVGDVALQAAIARALKLRKRPNEKGMEKISKAWRPWRTIAARLFWTHEDSLRKEKRDAEKRVKDMKAAKAKKPSNKKAKR